MKILVGLTIGLLLLLGVIVSLPFLIDLNQYQDQYKPLIEEALNRKVQLQDIRLTIWPRLGVRVAGLTVLDDPSFSAGPFASLTSLDIGVKLLPLFSRRVEVEEIALRDPVITIITNKAGTMNVSTIGAPTALPPSATEPGAPPSPGGNPLQLLALFAVERVSIDGGKLIYRDHSAAPVAEYQVQDLELSVQSVLLGESPSIHMQATVLPYNLPVTMNGTLGPLVERLEIQQYDFALGIGNIALAVKGALVDGILTATLSSPAINTANLPVALPLPKPVLIKDLVLSANAPYPLRQGVSPLELADISTLSLAVIMGESSVNITGTVLNGQADMTVSSPAVNTADLPVAVPLAKPVHIKDLMVKAKTRVPFNPAAPPLEIADVSDLRFAVALGQSLIDVKGTVLNGQAQMHVSSPSVNTTDLPVALPLTKPVQIKDLMVMATTRVPFNPAAPPLEIADVPDLRLTLALGHSLVHVKGTVLNGHAQMTASAPSVQTADLPVDTGLAKSVELKHVLVNAGLKGQQARLSNASFQLFNGQVKAEGGLSMGSPAPPFQGNVKMDGLQLGPALEALSPDSKVSLSGTAALDLTVAGRGFSLLELTQALEGPGHLRIKNGKIEGIDLMEEATTLLKVAGVSPDQVKTTVFSTIETDVLIKQGLVNVRRLLMESRDFQTTGTGTVGFDQALNLALNLNLSQSLSQKLAGSSPIIKIALKDGRLRLPLFITGTVQNPSYGLDTKALSATVQDQAQEKAKEAIKGLLDGTTDPNDLKQQGKELLKGLFKR